MTPPPGWYRDPHAPHLERWWDGTAWTEHRRPPEAPAAPPAPSTGGTGGPAAGGGRTKAVALTAAGAVLVAAVVTGAVFLRGDDGDTRPRTGPGATSPAATGPRSPSPSPPASASEPAGDPDVVEDPLNGVTFPLLDGWVRPEHVSQDDVVMTTDGTYDCPGEGSVCRHGLVVSRTVTATDETSPKVLAEKDVPDAAEEAFGEDALGQQPYGGVKSHEVVKSGPVAVAGRAGYFVRWRVTTGKGPGGLVQSLVFPSSVGTESPVVVRYAFDAGPDGPPPADMDRITKGIRSVTDADSGGGVGSSIGPTR
ncbi:DUF2510 domain-containing protein [Streptomyces sp. WAC 01438]|uniref:DUF2510 domain-containing protein n=1 Tax=Streptomyces sp. WAC 01438 TaxID=2203204 RepID=UPI000F702C23|nr:DUF2510 domain-containing protein [Streptomyces sp. WAC 01438]AZM63242.1 hypothetical protein DLM49_30080 [Streptomyces sp. WAC 01438]